MRSRQTVKMVTFAFASLLFATSAYYLLSRFHWREAFAALIEAHCFRLSLLIVIVHFAYILVRAWRWRTAVRASLPNVGLSQFYWITAVVVSLSILTPGHLGETLKVELMKRRGLLGRLPGIGAFAVERIMDLVMISSMGAIGLVFGNFAAPYPGLKAGAAVLVALGLLALWGLLCLDPGGRTSLWLAQLRRGGSPTTWATMALLTLLSWVLVAVNWQIALSAVQIHLTLSQVLLLISLVTIGGLLSFIPGGLGVAELVTTEVLINMGVVAVTAQAGALVLRAYSLIVVLFGLVHFGLWSIYGMYSHRYAAATEKDTDDAMTAVQAVATWEERQ